jgi:hypothetical protein
MKRSILARGSFRPCIWPNIERRERPAHYQVIQYNRRLFNANHRHPAPMIAHRGSFFGPRFVLQQSFAGALAIEGA